MTFRNTCPDCADIQTRCFAGVAEAFRSAKVEERERVMVDLYERLAAEGFGMLLDPNGPPDIYLWRQRV